MNVLRVTNPFNGTFIRELPLATEAELESALARAVGAFERTRVQPPFERAERLHTVAQAINQRRQEFIDAIVAEAGKPVTLAEAEVNRAIMTFTAAAEEARHSNGEVLDIDAFSSGAGHAGLVKRFPIGVIYGITPFNFPLNLVAHKVAPAMATGNAILIKPSPKAPLTALLLADVLREAQTPEGQVQVVLLPNEPASKAVEDERVAMVSFTGSSEVGWQIKAQAARKRVTLELGGNAAVIVHEDADLDAAIPMIATGGFAYAGQSCISVQRVLIHEPVYERARDMLVHHTRERVRHGDPRDRNVLVGPLIDAASLSRIRNWVATSAGKILCGGQADGTCLLPTIVDQPDLESTLCAEEAFAPVITLHPYRDFDQAVSMVNNSRYGLQAGVFTRDISRAWHAFESLHVGGVLINQVPTFRVETMPYGGVKDSGTGREGVRYAMREMTEPKSLIVKF